MGKYFHRFQICYMTGASCINQAKVSGDDARCMTTVYAEWAIKNRPPTCQLIMSSNNQF